MYIHKRRDWPDFHWNIEKLAEPLASVRYRQGGLIGQMKGLGFHLQQEAVLETLTKDVLKNQRNRRREARCRTGALVGGAASGLGHRRPQARGSQCRRRR